MRLGETVSDETSMTSTTALDVRFWKVAVMIARPGARERTSPFASIVATLGLSATQTAVRPGSGLPFLSKISYLRDWVRPGP